jgi:thiol-disulfide isomerase/thioredoxin
MKYILTLCVLTLFTCKNEVKQETLVSAEPEKEASNSTIGSLEIYDYQGIEKFLTKKDDKIYVINFWATWCKPCIKELPYFESINKEYKDQNVEVLLISLDFPQQFEKQLIPYIKEKNLQSKVVALDDPDMNTWIPKVSEDWTGAIPATIIYNREKRQFYERSFTYEELENELKQFLK